MFGWWRRQQQAKIARKAAISAEADRLQQLHGVQAYSYANMAWWPLDRDDPQRLFMQDVAHEVADRTGHRIGLDTSTRYFIDNGG